MLCIGDYDDLGEQGLHDKDHQEGTQDLHTVLCQLSFLQEL